MLFWCSNIVTGQFGQSESFSEWKQATQKLLWPLCFFCNLGQFSPWLYESLGNHGGGVRLPLAYSALLWGEAQLAMVLKHCVAKVKTLSRTDLYFNGPWDGRGNFLFMWWLLIMAIVHFSSGTFGITSTHFQTPAETFASFTATG